MGREQGDELEEPVIYVGEVNGETVEQSAYTPVDHVNFQARGWVQKNARHDGGRPNVAPAAPQVPAAKPAGNNA